MAYRGHPAVHHLSGAFMAGAMTAVVGPNGAGKSSLLAALLGQIAFSGTIRCHWRGNGRIGYVPQSFPVDPTLPLTVAELLALPRQKRPVCLGLAKHTKKKIAELLDQVALPGLANRRLGALSGGEIRRVLLANALDPLPELLLLDEPGTGLDTDSMTRLEAVILAAKSCTTVLMVSHDAEQVRRLADRVTVIDRVVQRTGSAAEIL